MAFELGRTSADCVVCALCDWFGLPYDQVAADLNAERTTYRVIKRGRHAGERSRVEFAEDTKKSGFFTLTWKRVATRYAGRDLVFTPGRRASHIKKLSGLARFRRGSNGARHLAIVIDGHVFDGGRVYTFADYRARFRYNLFGVWS